MSIYDNNSFVFKDTLTIETSESQLNIYGEFTFKKDKNGLKELKELQQIINKAVNEMAALDKKGILENNIKNLAPIIVDNPFKEN